MLSSHSSSRPSSRAVSVPCCVLSAVEALPICAVMGFDSRLDCGDLCLDAVNLILDNAEFSAFSRTRTEARGYVRVSPGRRLLHCCLRGKMRLVVRVIPRIGRTRAVTQVEQTRDNAI